MELIRSGSRTTAVLGKPLGEGVYMYVYSALQAALRRVVGSRVVVMIGRLYPLASRSA